MASVLQLILRSTKKGTAAKETSKDLLGLEKLAKRVSIAFLAMGAAKIIKSSTLLAARTETLGVVTKVLGANVGLTEKEIRKLERSIEDQGITLQKSRQAIAMMIQANVDLADATDLARLAQDTAVIAGVNSSEAFQQLVYVLQTGNVRMARTLGLNVQFGQAQRELAKELGKTTEALTEQEIMQARTNAVMEAGTRITGVYDEAMGTAGKTLLSMPRQIEAMQESLGNAFLPALEAVVSEVYEGTDAYNKFWKAMKVLSEAGIKADMVLDNFGVRTLARFGIITDKTRERILEMALAIRNAEGRTHDLRWQFERFPSEVEIEVVVGTEAAEHELETFGEWLTRWSRENARKVQLQAVLRISEELSTVTTEPGRIGGLEGGTIEDEDEETGIPRAMGGPVQAGKPYVVGEREAELFVPRQDGDIYNQQQLAGGDININTGVSQRAFNNMAEDWMRGLGG